MNDTIEELDWLKLQLAIARAEKASMQVDMVNAQLAAKYSLGEKDAIDPSTRKIVRGSKEAPSE